jgi:hypothetical protein
MRLFKVNYMAETKGFDCGLSGSALLGLGLLVRVL